MNPLQGRLINQVRLNSVLKSYSTVLGSTPALKKTLITREKTGSQYHTQTYFSSPLSPLKGYIGF
jgi:hypothetical protein